MLLICVNCNRIKDEESGKWYYHEIGFKPEKYGLNTCSHGYCPKCARAAIEELENMRASRNTKTRKRVCTA